MIRRLFPLCLVAALWGCTQSAPPTPPAAGTGTGTGGSTVAAPPKEKETEEPVVAQTGPKTGPTESTATEPQDNESAPTEKEMPAETKEEEANEEAVPAPATESPSDPAPPKEDGDDEPEEAPAPAATPDEPKDEPKDEAPKTVDELLASLGKAGANPDINEVAAQLEALLEKEPEHANGTLTLANIEQIRGRQKRSTAEGKEHFLKSAEYLRKLFKLNAELAENPGLRNFAGEVLYKGACAQALDQKPADALATLREAIGYGFTDLNQLNKNEDLASVRELGEFAQFAEDAKKMIKEANQKEVATLLEANEPYEFNFELDDINGKKIAKSEFAGKVMIVDIWGTWCPPCRAEVPHFIALDKELKEKGLQIIGLNKEQTDDNEEATKLVKEFIEKEGVTYPCALINDEVMNQVPNLQGFPTTLFIDRTGKVRLTVVGARGPEFLQAVVETLLAEKAPEAAGG